MTTRLQYLVRERRGALTLRETAAECGVSAPTLSRIERGESPDLETFARLCRWLGVSADSLLCTGVRCESRLLAENEALREKLRRVREAVG